ncbi:hypothetical protein PHYSODRAFT_299720 [Phytophthora sojae]|uniref:Uncharacterized protein n=1 Tax=Phytophthora sojae (strain P6497) TaxID=1094619 RepID=G4Z6F2_PHYSP|nr:hypothetical protein PHYSODRAFT_299720 [Phytophthora sojae]EGZ22400.1 hypothetical protein PHYSODRAFT_299720 [Phytophthora sojae]|eukprot:XP_009525117.1 hypothetical protein PHYSODRAFT_299720 [Phytophthora sojae]
MPSLWRRDQQLIAFYPMACAVLPALRGEHFTPKAGSKLELPIAIGSHSNLLQYRMTGTGQKPCKKAQLVHLSSSAHPDAPGYGMWLLKLGVSARAVRVSHPPRSNYRESK